MQASGKFHRIPTLDGWRGVAILMVLIDHACDSVYGDSPVAPPAVRTLGQHGVTVFFVLSGFLITSRLLAELDLTGTIRLGKFYFRRLFRLMPCVWIYLAVLSILYHRQHTTDSGLIPSLLFFRNYHGSGLLTGHFWTLSIEEQFYLAWPTLLVLFRRRAWIIAVLGCVTVCVWRSIDWNYLQSAHISASFMTQYRADALLIGCLLAIFMEHVRPFLKASLLYPLLTALFACILVFHKAIPISESLVIALLIGFTSSNPHAWISRALQRDWLVKTGLISYSVYVWQEFTLLHWGGRLWSTASIAIATALVLGYLSYRFVEQPMTSLGRSLWNARDISVEETATA